MNFTPRARIPKCQHTCDLCISGKNTEFATDELRIDHEMDTNQHPYCTFRSTCEMYFLVQHHQQTTRSNSTNTVAAPMIQKRKVGSTYNSLTTSSYIRILIFILILILILILI